MITLGHEICASLDRAESYEWLVTNGIGGYASGTVADTLTRRYHGLLIAMFPPPKGRTLLAAKLEPDCTYQNRVYHLGVNRWADGAIEPTGYRFIDSFSLDGQMPIWKYALGDALLEKRIWMRDGENTTYVRFRLLRANAPMGFGGRILVNHRDYHELTQGGFWGMRVETREFGISVSPSVNVEPIHALSDRVKLQPVHDWHMEFFLPREFEQLVESREDHLCVARFSAQLAQGESATFVFSAEPNPNLNGETALMEEQQRQKTLISLWQKKFGATADIAPPWIRQLVFAADHFMVKINAANGDRVPVLFSGYPWFEEWLRDALIGLEGLLLVTGREEKAKDLLVSCSQYLDRGMLPDSIPLSGEEPEYENVDDALHFVLALHAYWRHTGDKKLVNQLFNSVCDIIEWYTKGTRYNIHVDSSDGLLYAGEEGKHLSWMDADADGVPVTPRIGKIVSGNALWYNALRCAEEFARILKEDGAIFAAAAEKAKQGFEKFWNPETACSYDVIDGPWGNDGSIRPNQLFALSLPFMLFDDAKQKLILETCSRELLTPCGIRSLSPGHPAYRGVYEGSLNERNRAYHQGVSWPWLLGHFAIAHLKVHRDPATAMSYLSSLEMELPRYGFGFIGELYDSEPPYASKGCIAQAWSVAEILRAWHFITTFKP